VFASKTCRLEAAPNHGQIECPFFRRLSEVRQNNCFDGFFLITDGVSLLQTTNVYRTLQTNSAHFWVVSLNFRDEVLSAEYHKIRASQGTKVA